MATLLNFEYRKEVLKLTPEITGWPDELVDVILQYLSSVRDFQLTLLTPTISFDRIKKTWTTALGDLILETIHEQEVTAKDTTTYWRVKCRSSQPKSKKNKQLEYEKQITVLQESGNLREQQVIVNSLGQTLALGLQRINHPPDPEATGFFARLGGFFTFQATLVNVDTPEKEIIQDEEAREMGEVCWVDGNNWDSKEIGSVVFERNKWKRSEGGGSWRRILLERRFVFCGKPKWKPCKHKKQPYTHLRYAYLQEGSDRKGLVLALIVGHKANEFGSTFSSTPTPCKVVILARSDHRSEFCNPPYFLELFPEFDLKSKSKSCYQCFLHFLGAEDEYLLVTTLEGNPLVSPQHCDAHFTLIDLHDIRNTAVIHEIPRIVCETGCQLKMQTDWNVHSVCCGKVSENSRNVQLLMTFATDCDNGKGSHLTVEDRKQIAIASILLSFS